MKAMQQQQKDNNEKVTIYTNYGYLKANKKDIEDTNLNMISIKSENGSFSGTINVIK